MGRRAELPLDQLNAAGGAENRLRVDNREDSEPALIEEASFRRGDDKSRDDDVATGPWGFVGRTGTGETSGLQVRCFGGVTGDSGGLHVGTSLSFDWDTGETGGLQVGTSIFGLRIVDRRVGDEGK